ncbi:uncharacterized protein [Misgurnus anguillicaudatus]|uniref:uncharacterized protein isoform X1 n=1 Tax=Misgurnus anguillicaudatus TaxID=75329 RepID=UPI003CCFBFD6
MDHRVQRDKSRSSYFGNVKNRLGKLPAGISLPPDFVTAPCSIGAQGVLGKSVGEEYIKGHHQIRNPKLREYYLQEAVFPAEVSTTRTLESCRNNKHKIIPGATVYSVASQFDEPPLLNLTGPKLPKNKAASSMPTDSKREHSLDSSVDGAIGGTLALVSPSSDAEYDKLLDVEAVPLSDGRVCLLALPSECCQGDGPADMSCLRLVSRYITDRKGVVSGIFLVTSSKIFFDPQKSHPLVQENGCKEYVFSCSLDYLASVSFYTDISHIHFNKTTHRCQSCKTPKSKFNTQTQNQTKWNSHKSAIEAVPSPEPSGLRSLPATLGLKAEEKEEEDGVTGDMAEGYCTATSNSGTVGSLMFVRIRWKQQHGKRRALYESKITTRDTWFTMQQESSDKLYAYLSQHRPDLCILEGGVEDKAERDDEDFVLLDEEEQKQKEEDESPREGWAGEDWEMVTVEESGPRASICTEPEGLSDILNQSVILDPQQIKEISRNLPPRTIGHTWHLSYSTDKHGASLNTLYRKLSTTDSPVLVLIKDHNQQVFGSFLSHPLHPSEAFYGTGETFLFLSHPRFKCFRWTGENSFFIKGDLDSFAIGGGSGHFGLWVDERLYFGRSSPCFTFNNCSLSETNDFTILELEAWTFG